MYDNNPTLDPHKPLDESQQGSVFYKSSDDTSGVDPEKGVRHFYIESYGCAMNFSDSEIVASILGKVGFQPTKDMEIADLILINTCSIREKAEQNVRQRLRIFDQVKKRRKGTLVGVLGCCLLYTSDAADE